MILPRFLSLFLLSRIFAGITSVFRKSMLDQLKLYQPRLPFALNCLKRLDIYKITLGEFFDLSFALCLIRSSPNLEELEIKMFFIRDECCNEPVPRDAIDEIPASFSDMTFNTRRQ
ncbi:hypothetical protein T459_26932 [Capsicum annuum]|uniref:FBD domain-containing protein n=1 Tax=Capsicum annuum TaxID=4072 RepID=A0A2G2YCG8_CAPAN|nr:hypothetical protein T459_26932 [Capsicum annuum]